MRVSLIKGGMDKYAIRNPIFKPSPITPTYKDYLIFEGISVDEQGKQHYLDVNVAYRQGCLNAIEYLKKFGFRRPGLFHPGLRAGAGPYQRVVDIPQLLRHAVAADRDLRFRHPALGPGPVKHIKGGVDMPLSRDRWAASCPSMTMPAAAAASLRRCVAGAVARSRRLPAMRRVLGTHRGRRAGHLGAVVGGEPGARGERTQRQRAAQLARRPRHELRLLLGRTQVSRPGGGGRRQIFRRLRPG